MATLTGWWRADLLALGDGVEVDTWPDQSGYDNHLYATLTTRPLCKTGILAGNRVVRFDGVNDVMTQLGLTLVGVPSGLTLMAVVKGSAVAFAQVASMTDGGATSFELRRNGTGTQYQTIAAGGASPATAATAAGAGWRVVTARMDEINVWVYHDTTQEGTAVEVSSAAMVDIAVGGRKGGSLYWSGDIAEILFYEEALSAGNLATSVAYLKARHGI